MIAAHFGVDFLFSFTTVKKRKHFQRVKKTTMSRVNKLSQIIRGLSNVAGYYYFALLHSGLHSLFMVYVKNAS